MADKGRKNGPMRLDRFLAEMGYGTRTQVKDMVKKGRVRMNGIAVSIEGIATDPETGASIRQTLQNTREASEKANKMLSKLDQMKTEGSIEVLYSDDSERSYQTNASLKLRTSSQSFALFGIRDIGESDKLNLQLGRDNASWTSRFGLIDSRAGLGLDKRLGGRLAVSVDVYDPNEAKVRLGGQYLLGDNLYLVGQTDSVNRSEDRSSFFGLRRNF